MKKNNKDISKRKQKRYLKNKKRLKDKPLYSKFERQQEFIRRSLQTGVYNAFADKENQNG
jgi:hypothetical protein